MARNQNIDDDRTPENYKSFQEYIICNRIEYFRCVIPKTDCNDRKCSWLREVIDDSQIYIYDDNSLRFISQAENKFRVILIMSDNHDIILSICEIIRSMLPSKGVVLVSSSENICAHSSLLHFGVDDIVHIGMNEQEVKARLIALVRRLEWLPGAFSLDSAGARVGQDPLMRQIAGEFSPLEYRIMELLVEANGQVVPIDAFAKCLNRPGEVAQISNRIKVVMSYIRRKIPKDFIIVNYRGRGYKLNRNSDLFSR
ncbi:MAG TPA: winged helix-turn-helix domain-containing protein [Lacipirellulaceae bacterium]|nr:winged helix-turn-helix domain-containing protein [Lacipirellulaceae bacterium]